MSTRKKKPQPNLQERRFAEAVAYFRPLAKLTQAQLAKRIRCKRTTITNIENGQQRMLLTHALKLAKVLKIDLNRFK